TLVQLAAEPAIHNIKLKNSMTGHQGHLRQLRHVPGADDQTAAIGRLFDLPDQLGDLVYRLSTRPLPAPPLLAIDRTQVAIGIRPFIPDADPMLIQIADIRIAAEEP